MAYKVETPIQQFKEWIKLELQFHNDPQTIHEGNKVMKEGMRHSCQQLLAAIDNKYANVEVEYLASRAMNDPDILSDGFWIWFAILCRKLMEEYAWSPSATLLEGMTQGYRWRPLFVQGLTQDEAIKEMVG